MVQSDLITQFVGGDFESLTLNVTTNCCDTLLTKTIENTPVTENTVVIPIIGDTSYSLTEIRFLEGEYYHLFNATSYDLLSEAATLITDLEAWILATFGQTVTVDVTINVEDITITISDLTYPVEPITTTVLVAGEITQVNTFTSDNSFSLIQTTETFNVGEGVYHIELVATSDSGSQKIQRKCFFYDCTLACEIGEFILDNCETDVHLDYYVLKNMEYCECNCDNMCLLYKRILDKLNKEFCCGDSGVVTTNKCTSC